MGWRFAYNITQTVEERAKRAAQWKYEDGPTAREIPMIIDYINSPAGENNAIKKAYIGSGFYSGYVIDCDGTIRVAEGWAWHAPDKGWWDLPLAPIGDLHAWVDAYLADPPACYDGAATAPPTHPARPAPESGGQQPGPAGNTETPPSPRDIDTRGSSGCALAPPPHADSPAALLLLALAALLMLRGRPGREA